MDIDGSNFVRKKLVNAAVLREGRRADGVTVSQYAPYDYGYERLMLAKYVTESLSAQDRDAQILQNFRKQALERKKLLRNRNKSIVELEPIATEPVSHTVVRMATEKSVEEGSPRETLGEKTQTHMQYKLQMQSQLQQQLQSQMQLQQQFHRVSMGHREQQKKLRQLEQREKQREKEKHHKQLKEKSRQLRRKQEQLDKHRRKMKKMARAIEMLQQQKNLKEQSELDRISVLISEMSAKVEKNREVLGRELGELNKELAKSVKQKTPIKETASWSKPVLDWNEYQSKVSEIQEEKPRKYRVFYSGTKNPESLMARINAQLRNRMYSHGAIDGYISKKMEESS